MIIEVQSSPVAKTKTSYFGRLTSIKMFKKYGLKLHLLLVFSLRCSCCIVKIDLEWRNMHVHYGFICFTDMPEELRNVESTTIAQSKQFPDLLNVTDFKYFRRILLSKGLFFCDCTVVEC